MEQDFLPICLFRCTRLINSISRVERTGNSRPKIASNRRVAMCLSKSDGMRLSTCVLTTPSHAGFKLDLSTKDIEGAADGKINLAIAKMSYQFQISQTLCTSSVGHRNGAPFAKLLDKVFVNALLKAFIVCSVDEKFTAKLLKRTNVLYGCN